MALAMALGALLQPSRADVPLTGVNLAGAEFGAHTLPGTFGVEYTYPTPEEVDYYIGKGMSIFRIPFRWERLQTSLLADLDSAELGRLRSIVEYASGRGASVILDPHNSARYHSGVVGAAVPYAAFNDFWTRLAMEFKDTPHVIFGLVNEPYSMPTEQWFQAAQQALFAIRATGATNLIFVPGNAWTGAHSWTHNWYGTPNADVMINIVDPLDNFAFEVHQYLDNDSSGTSAQITSPLIGQQRLVEFTDWLREHGKRGFLGEFAVANSTIGAGIGDEALHNMLTYIEANNDVWLGWTWWAGGPWWGNDLFTIEPINLGLPSQADRPSMVALGPFLHPIAAGPWIDLGGGLAGSAGIPALTAQGDAAPGSSIALHLQGALSGAVGALVAGRRTVDLPLFGGLLVPEPNVIVLISTDGQGEHTTNAGWPQASIPGTQLFIQGGVIDPASVQGISMSNAIAGIHL